jgi:hypothetical protein
VTAESSSSPNCSALLNDAYFSTLNRPRTWRVHTVYLFRLLIRGFGGVATPGLVMGFDTHVIAGRRACSSSSPAHAANNTNRSNPHCAETLAICKTLVLEQASMPSISPRQPVYGTA